MPRIPLRVLISVALTLHLTLVGLALFGHRGTSYLLDDSLGYLAPYLVAGNWQTDTNRLALANANQFGERLEVEYHLQGEPTDRWYPLQPPALTNLDQSHAWRSLERRKMHYWLHQLSGLLMYENEEGVGRMLLACLKNMMAGKPMAVDEVRITVAPQMSMDEYREYAGQRTESRLPEAFQPQAAYRASVVDLGDGELSLLPQTEARRASRSTGANKP